MQNSRDLSIWRSLAVAFGDGLAFGVGMKLSQNAARSKLIEDRPRQSERSPQAGGGSFDSKVLEAVVNALEARLNEHTAQMERHLAELESLIAVDLRALQKETETLAAALREEVAADNREFAQTVGARMEQDLADVRQEMVAVNRDFAQSVSRIVAEQLSAGTAGLKEDAAAAHRELVDSMPRLISEQVAFQMEGAANAVQHSVEGRLAVQLRQEIREKSAATDSRMLEFITAMGQVCRQVSERVASSDGDDPGPPAEIPAAEPEPDLRVPDFTQTKGPAGLWRVPLVSSMIITVGGLVAMHYL